MALTYIRLKNFKSFADSGVIPVAPLTLIFGRNNTGKSSILQSLLILRQTIDSPEYAGRLNLRGPLYQAGSYSDLVHQHQSSDHIVMQFGLGPVVHSRRAALEFEFRADEPQSPKMTRLTVSTRGVQPLIIRSGRGAGGPYELVIGDDIVGREGRANFFFGVNRLIPLLGPDLKRAGMDPVHRKSRRLARETFWDFQRVLRNLRGVGPFRQRPERRYEFYGRLPDRMDLFGEAVVNALIEDATRRRHRGELTESVNRWLKQVGRVQLMPLRPISRAARLFEIRVKDTDSGRWANYADVGFGIGQALPVLIEGLRTPEDGLFLVQEPEIHLHPDAQIAMADFLIALVLSGRRVIVETHSEHLLLRVRHRVIASASNGHRLEKLTPAAVSIIYVDKTKSGASQARPLHIDHLGQVTDWPAGFMEEATKERLALMKDMAAKARR